MGGGVIDPPSNPSPFPEEVLASVDNPDDEGNGLFKVTPELDGWTEPELRYAGVNYVDDNTPYVHNYVTFNNEKAGWRIIGLVNVLVIQPNGSKQVEQRLKIIRDKPNTKEWDSGNVNDWTQASLMKDFNDTTGEYYQTLTEDAIGMIDKNIIWNLGGISDSEYSSLKANEFYKKERGTTGGGAAPTTTEWPMPDGGTYTPGKALVGLMYPSDYGYGVGGASRDTCLTTALYNYSNTCADNDWLFLGDYEWLLSPRSSNSLNAFYVRSDGLVSTGILNVGLSCAVRPVVYLTSKVKISGGTGEHGNPYTLSVQ